MLDADGSERSGRDPGLRGRADRRCGFREGIEISPGWRHPDMPFHRGLGNKVFVLLVRIFFGSRYSDLCYGYNAFWSDALAKLGLSADGFEIETMMNIRALRVGLRVTEVASFEHQRRHGEGGLKTFPDGWRVLRTILAERLRRADFDLSGTHARETVEVSESP